MTNPVLGEVLRGGIVESFHRGAICVVGPGDRTILAMGDVTRDVYPRSAIKIFQALPLIESGAAAAFGFDDKSLALACASHSGEARHSEQAAVMLKACRADVSALECGAHRPLGANASWDLAAGGEVPSALHNNCSGKHAGMVATALHLGEDPAGYVLAGHPVQTRIREIFGTLTDTKLDAAPVGTDGCSVPTWALPLRNMAMGLSRLVTGEGPGADHKAAGATLMKACFAEPELTSGDGRRCAEIMRASGLRAYVKTGAEGVYCGAIPELGAGIALKIDDGGTRVAELAVASVVAALLKDGDDALHEMCRVTMRNWRGIEVGTLEQSDDLKQALTAIR